MTIKSSGELVATITSDLADNSTRNITAAKIRNICNDIVECATHQTVYTNTSSGAVSIDLHQSVVNLTLSGHVTSMTTINRDAGLANACKVRMYAGAADRNLAFSSSWKWLGALPTGIPATRYGLLTLTSFGTAETDILAAYEIIGSGV